MIAPLASAWDSFAIGFGAATAILVVGGIVLLRWQRNRHEQAILQAALARGESPAPVQPPWLVSMRQGVLTLALGAGMCLCGWAARAIAERIEIPALPTTRPAAEMLAGPKPRDLQGRLTPEGRLYTLVRSQWERQQNQKIIGFVLLGCGGILVILGLTRMGFALVERTYGGTPVA